MLQNPFNPGTGYFCPTSQPAWSAYRDPSYGTATLKLLSANQAQFSWYRVLDGGVMAADSVLYTRTSPMAPSPTPVSGARAAVLAPAVALAAMLALLAL